MPDGGKKFHIALSVSNIEKSIQDYSQRLAQEPCVVVKNEYALWRTPFLNFSIRQTHTNPGQLRHLGWEEPYAQKFTETKDCNGITWENFDETQQKEEILSLWPQAKFHTKK